MIRQPYALLNMAGRLHMGSLRRWLEHLVIIALLALAVQARADAPQPTPIIHRVESIGITVEDLDRAVDFYTKVLSFERVADSEVTGDLYEHLYGVFGLRLRTAILRLGNEQIELMQFIAPRGRPTPVDSKSNDVWFQHVAIIVSDMERAYALLREHGVEHASTGPQLLPAWNTNAGGISAFYFRDPDGNHLEILQFPADKGDRRWQAKDELFLGIDHTAIVVSDTEASLKFYRDAFGMRVAGTSENYGPEQERLNNVFGARLRITALRAAEGPGVELLEYLAPRTGRPMPLDTQANDAWHWQINVAALVEPADRLVRAQHYRYVSSGPVKYANDIAGLMIRDPDGHALMLRQTR
jgi:catechol 2,3-dioxygenase-like lactoylglutathione lyase family enzyme